MALSADEQRALAEIERRLASDDPGLASCLTAFRRPGPARVLRSPRARIIGSLFTVLLVAMVSLMVYAMIPFRTHGGPSKTPSAGTAGGVSVAATGTVMQPRSAPPASAGSSASGSAVANSLAKSATPSAGQSAGTSQAQATGSQAQATGSQAQATESQAQATGSQAAGSQEAGQVASPAAGP